MSYAIYETEAVVLGSVPVRERGLALSLLTRELGFLRVRAEGVRTSVSKMRLNLTCYGRVSVSLVRGRHEWRLVGARAMHSFAPVFAAPIRGRTAARIMHLYGRLIPDEATGHEVLFDELVEGLALLEVPDVPHEAVEALLVVRALSHLGYLPDDAQLTHLLCSDCELKELVADAAAARPHAVVIINQALASTQL